MWGPILEKAWAKLRGSYANVDGGILENGIRSLTGAPVFSYKTSTLDTDAKVDEAYQFILTGEQANYVMGASTRGTGDDSSRNHCGIYMSHAYSILAAFTLKDATHNEQLLLIRNPWGRTGYTGLWNYKDTKWTDELVK